MRKLIFLLIIILLTSCSTEEYDVKLSNGAIVPVVDYSDRKILKDGAKVCVYRMTTRDEWVIDDDGKMWDTSYIGITNTKVEYRIGTILHRK